MRSIPVLYHPLIYLLTSISLHLGRGAEVLAHIPTDPERCANGGNPTDGHFPTLTSSTLLLTIQLTFSVGKSKPMVLQETGAVAVVSGMLPMLWGNPGVEEDKQGDLFEEDYPFGRFWVVKHIRSLQTLLSHSPSLRSLPPFSLIILIIVLQSSTKTAVLVEKYRPIAPRPQRRKSTRSS